MTLSQTQIWVDIATATYKATFLVALVLVVVAVRLVAGRMATNRPTTGLIIRVRYGADLKQAGGWIYTISGDKIICGHCGMQQSWDSTQGKIEPHHSESCCGAKRPEEPVRLRRSV